MPKLNCLAGLRILDIGCGAGLLCDHFTRLGAQVIGIDPPHLVSHNQPWYVNAG